MEKLRRFKNIFIAAGVLLLIFLVVAGIYWQSAPRMMYPQEIREYQGENLSSISDFRENSIKGPQYVNESAYRSCEHYLPS